MFDVIVVGGGPAGLSAALMLGRCRRRVLICDIGQPRNRHSHALHGYLTRDGVPPFAFNALGREELVTYGIELRSVGVTDARPSDEGFRVTLTDGAEEESRFLLLATGVADELPPVAGIGACYGRSVFHCPYCDGWEWRDRRLAVVGIGKAGLALALSLKTWSPHVLFCANGSGLDRRNSGRLRRNGIEIRSERIDRLDHDQGLLSSIVFDGGEPAPCDALFFTTGQHPQCDLAVRLGCAFNIRGTVATGLLSNTNIPRLFVAGDASRDSQFVVVAAAEGIKAAVAINKELQKAKALP
jgi:thioredoxin reductase